MEKTLPSSELYSHPNRLLEDHLTGVMKLSELFLSEKPVEIKEKLTVITRIIALSHDVGKSTNYFQGYLNAVEPEKFKLKNLPQTKHSFLSAICTYYLCKEIKTDNELFPFFAFLTVRRHHGNFINISDEVTLYTDNDIGILQEQIESIDSSKFSILAEYLHNAGLSLVLDKETIKRWIDNFVDEFKIVKKNVRKFRELNNNTASFITLNLLYSILLDADKSDVVIRDFSIFERSKFISGNFVDNYKAQNIFPAAPINYLREKAYDEVVNSTINPDEKIYSINLPTGLGKTLTAFSFALKLRDNLKQNHRIIYALPFLSIIDQNSIVIESVLKTNNVEPYTNIFLKHHHLSDIFYRRDTNEFESDQAKILVEGWNAEIIVTTFVQLFHSLISNRNKSIRKFHRIANSIIILDEIQSIPVKYWLLLQTLLKEISEMLNVYIILVTATKPLIFEEKKITELVNRKFYFNKLNRISIKPLLNNVITVRELSESFDLNNKKRHLFIFNTITSAKDFYNLTKNKNVTSIYLSTHIIPKDRLERIRNIQKGTYRTVVSTQIVEAGVDIDFDVVIRDIAPLDSINQSAGRCNRNGKQKGEVYLVSLKGACGRLYASYIYDPVLLDITRKILTTHNEIKESELLDIIDIFYTETSKKKSQDISKRLLEAIVKLRYDSEDEEISIGNFKLIEEDYLKKDVFIEIDEDAKKIWQKYLDLKSMYDLFDRKKMFDSIKADFYQYVISIPTNVENMPPEIGEIGYVKQSSLVDYYDRETGFITKDTKTIVIW